MATACLILYRHSQRHAERKSRIRSIPDVREILRNVMQIPKKQKTSFTGLPKESLPKCAKTPGDGSRRTRTDIIHKKSFYPLRLTPGVIYCIVILLFSHISNFYPANQELLIFIYIKFSGDPAIGINQLIIFVFYENIRMSLKRLPRV